MNRSEKKEFSKRGLQDVSRIVHSAHFDTKQKCRELFLLLQSSLDQILEEEGQSFISLFAQISYAGRRFKISASALFAVHRFRKRMEHIEGTEISREDLNLALHAMVLWFKEFSDDPVPSELSEYLEAIFPNQYSGKMQGGFAGTRDVLVIDFMQEAHKLVVLDPKEEGQERFVSLSAIYAGMVTEIDLQVLKKFKLLPLKANLLELTIDEEGLYLPKGIILEPDYLIDVTAIANCFTSFQSFPVLYLLKKFQEVRPNKHLLLGNLANQMLDMLIEDTALSFEQFIPYIFAMDALGFALCDNNTLKEILSQSAKHFEAIREVILEDFSHQQIDPGHVLLEPSFFAPEYGLQGRLDLLHIDDKNQTAHIIELKSGKAFQANSYGLGQSHYVQTLLYDLMVKSVFRNKLKPTNFILYSGEVRPNLRFAPPVKAQQIEALAVRNKVIVSERMLSAGNLVLVNQLMLALDQERHADLKGFVSDDLKLFKQAWSSLDSTEQQYCSYFISFIAREQYFSKLGEQSIDKRNGLADLWLGGLQDKLDQLVILNHLLIKANNTKSDPPTMTLSFTEKTNNLSNFRVGDIIVMYPAIGLSGESVLRNQIFKASIIQMHPQEVTIRFRAKQMNQIVFDKSKHWHLEHDTLDSGFNRQYESLFRFMRSGKQYRDLVLGRRMPKETRKMEMETVPGLTEQQQDIFERIVASEEYFLLWGPPGTGKTSIMLAQLVRYLVNTKQERILLLAYTNRAVDEICRAIEGLGDKCRDGYIRIGSRYACEDTFRHALFDSKIAEIQDRGSLRRLLRSHRIYVATLASFSTRVSLLDILSFDRILIDEASQILEPGLVGLLQYFPKWVLIGDHRQLPAVVTQPETLAVLDVPELRALNLLNGRDSLFERLYLHCQIQGWEHAYGSLHFQGRMHPDIMKFASDQFYNGKLKALLQIDRFKEKSVFGLSQYPWKHRMIFIPADVDLDAGFSKTNAHELDHILYVLQSLKALHGMGDYKWDPFRIGIISPFRAQIAAIKTALEKQMPDILGIINIDTVERYQGGAKDIIIFSLCINRQEQMDRLSVLSREGIDRKLNVAVTRAREQFILIGNKAIMIQNPVYKELISLCETYVYEDNRT